MPYIAIIHVPAHTADDVIAQAHTLEQMYGSRVVGLFEYPERKSLKCSGTCTVKNTGAWVRDEKGFMKCNICGSRNRNVRRWLMQALFDFLGHNLYPDAPAAFKTPSASR